MALRFKGIKAMTLRILIMILKKAIFYSNHSIL